jgi:hypothetical protein
MIVQAQVELACLWNLDDIFRSLLFISSPQTLLDNLFGSTIALNGTIFKFLQGLLRPWDGLWHQAFKTPSYIKFFNSLEEEVFRYTLPRTMHNFTSRTLKRHAAALSHHGMHKIIMMSEKSLKRA